jgi:hypothetical protein
MRYFTKPEEVTAHKLTPDNMEPLGFTSYKDVGKWVVTGSNGCRFILTDEEFKQRFTSSESLAYARYTQYKV